MQTTIGQTALCPFTVIVDSAEKAPYRFLGIPAAGRDRGRAWRVPIVRRYLKTGDYTIDGLEKRIAIERKSLEDLFTTLGKHRDRFEHEVARLNEMSFAAIVIEADLREVWRPRECRPNWRSRLWPRSVEGTIVSWSIRYPKVHWWPCGSRRAAEIRTFEVLEKFWKMTENTAWRPPTSNPSPT